MELTLKMTIQGQDFELKTNLTNAAGRIYRQQFTRDLLRDMNEIYKKLHKSPFDDIDLGGIDIQEKSEQEIYDQIISKVNVSKLLQAREQISLDFEEEEKGSQIIWAFAKNADKDLPGFQEWIDGFDFVLPVGDIVSTLYEAWTESARPTVELKN